LNRRVEQVLSGGVREGQGVNTNGRRKDVEKGYKRVNTV
jgi:hypothetical protein